MMEKFSVVSVNVRGIRAEAKRIKIFTQLKEKNTWWHIFISRNPLKN